MFIFFLPYCRGKIEAIKGMKEDLDCYYPRVLCIDAHDLTAAQKVSNLVNSLFHVFVEVTRSSYCFKDILIYIKMEGMKLITS